MTIPRLFALHRQEDVTGVSGTGTVAHGVVFPDGEAVIRWVGDRPSTVVWDGLSDAMAVHGHDGRTKVVWLDEQADAVTLMGPSPAEIRYAAKLVGVAATEARDELVNALADCVIEATEYGEQDNGFIAAYILPTGPVHRAVPLLERHGVTVRPGFDGRTGPNGGELKTPAEWLATDEFADVRILDTDGWRGVGAPLWVTPITRVEFETRLARCTIATPAHRDTGESP